MPDVVYTLSLKDQLTNKLNAADSAAQHLEGTLKTIGQAAGLGFGIYKVGEFLESSFTEYRNVLQAQSQIQAGLKSTAGAAGMTEEGLNKGATALRQHVLYSLADIKDMQAQALSFNGITKNNFTAIEQATMDVATRVKLGLHETSIQMGKAFDDPTKGIMNLHREGIDFTKEQIAQITKLQAAGKITQAQTLMLTAITKDYGGSAKAAFDADPLAQYNLGLESAQDALGALEASIMKDIMPTILELLSNLKELVEWIQKNGDQIWIVIKALGAAYISFKSLYTVVASYKALMLALAPATEGAAVATGELGTAMDVALGPIGLVALAIGGLVTIYYELGNNIKIANEEQQKMFAANASGETDYINTIVSERVGFGMNKTAASIQVRQEQINKLSAEAHNQNASYWQAVADLNHAKDGSDLTMLAMDSRGQAGYLQSLKNAADASKEKFDNTNAELKAAQNYAPQTITKAGKPPKDPNAPTKETKGAKGNRVVTINIKIDALQKGDIKIQTTNIKESAGKIHDMITGALMGAVNDSQIVAEK